VDQHGTQPTCSFHPGTLPVDENYLADYVMKLTLCWEINSRDRKEPETSKNEPNQNPGFAKSRTEPKPGSKSVQESKPKPAL